MQESLDASLVRIRTADGRVVGAGFLVGERHILTCAHVISQALSLLNTSVDPPQGLVSLDFPRLPPRTLLTARVVLWCSPSPDGSGDLAGLELEREPPTGAEVVRFASVEEVWKHDFSVLGFPTGYDDGVWATGRLLRRQATNWIQIEDVKTQGFPVGPGFSGTPVWDEQLLGVVGMVVTASRPADTKTAFVIPMDVLAAAWPLLTVPQGQPRNPYKGLRPFTQRDAADFFGREAVVEKVAELVNSLVTDQPGRSSTRLLTILGPSGAGKSSLVMAGLLPQLQRGMLPGSDMWLSLDPIVPGKHPLESLVLTLAAQLPERSFSSLRDDLEDEAGRGLHQLCTHLLNIHRREQPGARVLLLVDQCEELFTQTESEDERQRFIRLLLTACSEPRGPLVVLLTLRADFYDRPMQYPELFRSIDTQHLSLLAIEPGDLRRVIEQPAALSDVQVTFEGDLVHRLLSDVQGQVGTLPLLQFTLDQLFQRRSERQLTLSAYREIGGVKGALAKHAESIYAALPSEKHRTLARALFLRLIDPGTTEQDTTRRRAALAELSLPDPEQTAIIRETADAFVAARLLTTNVIAGTTTIEVSHEALIREWARLAGWLREAREDITLQQAISEDATEWMRRGKPIDRLYRGTQLAEAQEWVRRNVPSADEIAFLQTSAAEHQQREAAEQIRQARELTLQRQAVNRLRLLVATFSIFTVVATVLSLLAGGIFLQAQSLQKQAQMQAQIALSRAIAAKANYSLSQNEFDRALLLSVKALQTANTYEARNNLLLALEQSARINTMLRANPMNPVNIIGFTSNGTSLISLSGPQEEFDVWDTKARTYHILSLGAQAYYEPITSLALSPTDQTMITVGQNGVWLWDIQTGTQLAQLAGWISLNTNSVVQTSTAFSKDGKVVAFSRCTQVDHNSNCVTSQIEIWNVAFKQRIGSPLIVQGEVSDLSLSPDHQMLAYTLTVYTSDTSAASVQLWNVATGQSIGPLVGDRAKLATSATFSPGGKILATINLDNTLQLWDVAVSPNISAK